MKNIFVFSLLMVILSGAAFAENANISEKDLLVGVCNKDNKCGVVNLKGETVIPFNYSWIKADPGDFNIKKYFIATKPENGVFDMNLDDDKYGIIDNKGNTILDFEYDYVHETENGSFEVKKNGYYGYVDITGKEIIPIKYKRIEFASENFVALSKDGQKWGYVTTDGKFLTPFNYTSAGHFKNGYAVVEINNKSGVIDNTGKLIIKPKYDHISVAPNGLFEVSINNKIGFLNSKGKAVVPVVYKSVNSNKMYEEGLVAIQNEDSMWGFLDGNGKVAIPFIYSEARNFVNGVAYVVKDDKSFYIDKTGKETLPFNIDSSKNKDLLSKLKIYDKYYYNNGAFYVEKDGYHGVLDMSGNIVVPLKYDRVYVVENGLYKVENSNNRYLFYDKSGKLITNTPYDYAFFTGDKFIQVSQMRKNPTANDYTVYDLDEGLIDNKGNVIIPLVYDRLEYHANGYFIVTKDSRIKLLDINGITLIDFGKYDAFCTDNGVFSKYY